MKKNILSAFVIFVFLLPVIFLNCKSGRSKGWDCPIPAAPENYVTLSAYYKDSVSVKPDTIVSIFYGDTNFQKMIDSTNYFTDTASNNVKRFSFYRDRFDCNSIILKIKNKSFQVRIGDIKVTRGTYELRCNDEVKYFPTAKFISYQVNGRVTSENPLNLDNYK